MNLRTSRIVLVLSALLLAVAAFLTPLAFELRTISTVITQFRADASVEREQLRRDEEIYQRTGKRTLTLAEVMDPPYLVRFGLRTQDYLDKNGYFAPNGNHWKNWHRETQTAAILMWTEGKELSSWDIHKVITTVDDYYKRNDPSTAVVMVVRGTVN